MPISKLIYKRCCVCGKKFPIIMEETVDPHDFVNFQPCKCDSCQGRKKNYQYGPQKNPAPNDFYFGTSQGIPVE